MGINNTGRRSLDRLAADARVERIWMENDGFRDDGRPSYWLALADGYSWEGCAHLHEGTIAELLSAFASVEKVK